MENDKAGATFKSKNLNSEVDEMLATYKKMNDQMIKNKQWTKSSYNTPLEVHIQLIIIAFKIKNKETFESLLMSILINIKFRKYEVSYVSTIHSSWKHRSEQCILLGVNQTIHSSYHRCHLDL